MTIGLLAHMGYGNLGDAAIQDAVIANIQRRLPDVRLVGFSLIPDDTANRHGIPCYPIKWWYPRLGATAPRAGEGTSRTGSVASAVKRLRLVRAWLKPVADLAREALFWLRSYRRLRRLDVLVISGSGQLGEHWRGPWAHPYTIFKFAVLAKLARTKLYFLNVGAGPLEHPLSRFFIRWAVRLGDYRSFRDQDSQELVRSLGVDVETHVYPDPVYSLDVAAQLAAGRNGSPRPVVGLNPIGFCDPRLWYRKDEPAYRDYLDKMTAFSAWLLEQGYDLRVFTNELSVDRYAIEDLRARLQAGLSAPEVVLDRVFGRPSETVKDVLQEMAGFDFIVTSKFHGIVFSHILRKPVIALSYHRKMDVAMNALGQGRFCADVGRFEVGWLIEALRALVSHRDGIRSRCGAAVEANAARLSQQFDGLFSPLLLHPTHTRALQ
jgi:polysaccharide pyruvyl transferase WcaK-like protein